MIPLGYRGHDDRPELPAWVLVFAWLSALKATSSLALLTFIDVLDPPLEFVELVLLRWLALLFAVLAIVEGAVARRHPASWVGMAGGMAAMIWIAVEWFR